MWILFMCQFQNQGSYLGFVFGESGYVLGFCLELWGSVSGFLFKDQGLLVQEFGSELGFRFEG